MTALQRGIIFGCAFLLAACSGGAASTAPTITPTGQGQGATAALTQTVNFTVNVPPAQTASTSAVKRRATSTVYVSPAIASISFQLESVNGTTLAHLPPPSTPTNIACPNPAAGCAVTVSGVAAAAGTDLFNVTTFSAKNGSGGVISSGIISVTVPGSGSGSATVGSGTTLSIGGFVAGLALTAIPNTVVLGTPSTATVVVTPRDAGGATIIGNVQFANPIVISASDTTLKLSGPDLISNVVTLVGPEDANHPITVAYGGTPTIGTLVATSQDASGNTVTSAPLKLVAVAATPPPTQTPSGGGTNVPLPGPTRSPGPGSLYVLNGSDNSIVEFAGPTSASPYPVRRFGGANVGCAAGQSSNNGLFYGSDGIAVDPNGDVVVGNGPACNASNGVSGATNSPETLYEFAPSAIGTTPPRAFSTKLPASIILTLLYNQSDGSFDVADENVPQGAPFNGTFESAAFVTRYRLQGSIAQVVGSYGNPLMNPASAGCVVTQVAPYTSPCNYNATPTAGALSVDLISSYVTPFWIDSQGNTYLLSTPYVDGTQVNPGGLSTIARLGVVVVLPPQPDSSSPTALSAWLAPPPTFGNQSIFAPNTNPLHFSASSLANIFVVDANNLFILEAPDNSSFGPQVCDPNPGSAVSGTPSSATCKDGQAHSYLLKFDLSQILNGASTKPGQVSSALPTLVLGGDSLPNSNTFVNLGNAITVGGGKIYIANGLNSGEIDIYNENLTGYHVEDGASAPSAKIVSPLVNIPIGIAYGQGGTATGGLAATSVRRQAR